MKATLEKIKEIFRNEVDQQVAVEKFDADRSISEQGVDSLDRSSVFLALEDEFGIHFSDREVAQLDTYNKIIEFINSKS